MSEIGGMQQRAWIRLPSGRHLDLINPAPDAWTNEDLAKRLSRTYRWAGESCWPLSLPVSQHCLLVLTLRRMASTTPLTAGDALNNLFHDGDEGLLGFDCISPLKAVLGQPFKDLCDSFMRAIALRYKLPEWTPETYALYKHADNTAAASEALHCAGWSRQEIREVLKISHPILEVDPLAEIYNCNPWEPWTPDVATERFLAELENLTANRKGNP